jgi:hypothetical protein
MPKSRGRGGRRKPYRSPKPQTIGGNNKWGLVTDMNEFESFKNQAHKDYKSSRSAMVAGALMFGHRFPEGSVSETPGPNGEAWTNAWYTAKENKDKGWRYCEGIVKLPNGIMTSAWCIDGYGHLVECSADVDAEWYQGFVLNEDNDMMNQGGKKNPKLVWDEGLPRPVVAERGDYELLDGERQLEAVSRVHGEAWLGSMMETAISALRQAYGMSYVKALVTAMPNIVDQEATDKYPKGPDYLKEGDAFEEVADFGPGNPAEATQRAMKKEW